MPTLLLYETHPNNLNTGYLQAFQGRILAYDREARNECPPAKKESHDRVTARLYGLLCTSKYYSISMVL